MMKHVKPGSKCLGIPSRCQHIQAPPLARFLIWLWVTLGKWEV